jgi:hypothetical protein
MFTLTIYKDSSSRSIVNLYDLVNYGTLDAAIEYASLHNLPYTIKEISFEKITDLNYTNDDSNSNVEYFVCSDCENWTDYYFPHKTFNEARDIALKCIEKEHCRAYIEKHFEKTIVEVY